MNRKNKTIRKLTITATVLCAILAVTLISSCLPKHKEYPKDEYPQLEEHWSYGKGKTKVARIALEGIISRVSEDSLFSPRFDMVENLILQIRTAKNDPAIQGILLEINSPGGGVTPSDEIYNALKEFKQSRQDRRVIVFVRDFGASGAYYAAMAGDWIIAEPTSAIGSIGVIMQTLNFQKLSEKIGLTDVTIKSGENKDLLNPFEPVDPKQIGLLQDLIDNMYNRFVKIVSDARGINSEEKPELFDGRIFSTDLALANGLIDEIGYWDDAYARSAELLNVDSIRLIRYEPKKTFIETLIEGKSPVTLPNIKLCSPEFLYLWNP